MERWQSAADEIQADICKNAIDERGVFCQHYETDALDASVLLMPLVRFLPAEDERIRATVLAIADELTVDGLVLHKVEETDDGLSGEEGTFAICPSGQRRHEPKGADGEGALLAPGRRRSPPIGEARALPRQLVGYREHRRPDLLVLGRQEAHERHHQDRRVERVGLVVLQKTPRSSIRVLADVGVDLVRRGLPCSTAYLVSSRIRARRAPRSAATQH